MLRYKIDGVMYDSPIVGLDDITREIFRGFGTNSDAILNTRTTSSVSFTGSAFAYICSKISELCYEFQLEKIADDNSVEYSAVFYSYMIELEHTPGLATTQLLESSWSAIFRNRTKIPVFLSSFKTIECDAMDRPVVYAIDVYKGDGTLQDVNYRYGLDVFDVLDHIVKFLTNGNMEVVSNFFQNNHYAIFTGTALGKFDFDPVIPGRSLSRRDIYPTLTFDSFFESLRKIFGVFIEISGNQIIIEPESYFFDDANGLISFDNIPPNMISNINRERLFSTVNVGGNLDDIGNEEDDEPYNTFPQKNFFAFNQEIYSSCNCESDKDNSLDLGFDMFVDSNTIVKTLATGGKKRDDIFLIEYIPTDNTHPITREGYAKTYPIGSKIYYNDTLKNVKILDRWNTYINGCLLNTQSGDDVFISECGIAECENIYRTAISQPTGTLLGRLFFPNPATSIDPDGIDSYGGWINRPGNINQNSVMNNDYSGYEIQIPMSYAFTARSALMIGPHFDIVDIEYSITIYEDSTLSNEIYRISIFEHYEDIENTEAIIYEISTDVLDLEIGNVAVVETRASFQWSGRPTLGDVFWFPMRFFIDTDLMACDLRINYSDSKPFIYEFETELCESDFALLASGKTGYIEIEGVKCYIQLIVQNSRNIGNFTLISNQNICQQC